MPNPSATRPVTREEFQFCVDLAFLKASWSNNGLFVEQTVDSRAAYQINPSWQPLLDRVTEKCGLEKKTAWTIEEMKGLFDQAESLIK